MSGRGPKQPIREVLIVGGELPRVVARPSKD